MIVVRFKMQCQPLVAEPDATIFHISSSEPYG